MTNLPAPLGGFPPLDSCMLGAVSSCLPFHNLIRGRDERNQCDSVARGQKKKNLNVFFVVAYIWLLRNSFFYLFDYFCTCKHTL